MPRPLSGLLTGFTVRASCLLAAGITALLCGLVLGIVDLVRAGVLAAAIPLVASAVVRRSRLQLSNTRTVEPARAAAGESVVVHLVITNHSPLRTGTLRLEDTLPTRLTGRARFVLDPLGRREFRTVSYRMPRLNRGHYRTGPLQIRLGDPFRLIELTRSFTSTADVVVTPVVEALPSDDTMRAGELGEGAGSTSIGMHGADDQSTREYRVGDDLRKIHWRSSARTGQLMVRQEERPWRGQDTLLLDLRARAHAMSPPGTDGGGDNRHTSSLEWAISAAATVGTQLLRGGQGLTLIDGSTGSARTTVTSRYALADHLAGVLESGAADLSWADDALTAGVSGSTAVAVLGRLDPMSLRTLVRSGPTGRSTAAVALLLDVDSWADPLSTRTDDATTSAARALRSAGWLVHVVHRGETVAQAWAALRNARAAGAGAVTAGLR